MLSEEGVHGGDAHPLALAVAGGPSTSALYTEPIDFNRDCVMLYFSCGGAALEWNTCYRFPIQITGDCA